MCYVLPCIALRASMRHHASASGPRQAPCGDRQSLAGPFASPLAGGDDGNMIAAGRQTRRRFDAPMAELIAEAAALRDSAHGRLISYSRKVFIPLTTLCRDVCHYCTFAKTPRAGKP